MDQAGPILAERFTHRQWLSDAAFGEGARVVRNDLPWRAGTSAERLTGNTERMRIACKRVQRAPHRIQPPLAQSLPQVR